MHSNACTHCSMNEISIVKVYIYVHFIFLFCNSFYILHFNLFISIF